jgi:putative transposase
MSFWHLYYHLLLATRERMPLIPAHLEPELHRHLVIHALQFGATVHAVNGVEDHIHLVTSIPSWVNITDFVGCLKESSTLVMNQRRNGRGRFAWQNGYGILSIGPSNLERTIKYVRWQKEHHAEGTVVEALELIVGELDHAAIAAIG